jgi:hypothetical protein
MRVVVGSIEDAGQGYRININPAGFAGFAVRAHHVAREATHV